MQIAAWDAASMRNAVGHEAERSFRAESIDEHAYSGELDGPGLSLKGQGHTVTHFRDRALSVPRKMRMISLKATNENAAYLDHIVEAAYSAFDPVATGLSGIDLAINSGTSLAMHN